MNLLEITKRNKPIILVFGKLCSGKGTYCAPLVKRGYHHITTSSVVKHLLLMADTISSRSGEAKRDQLQKTGDKADQIAQRLIQLIEQHDKVIIDGIRQNTIVDAIVAKYGFDKIDMVWLEVPDAIRSHRFTSRADAKDTQDFATADRGDVELGLDDVLDKYKSKMTVVDNFDLSEHFILECH